jgi:CheY-like chemotaxis protein
MTAVVCDDEPAKRHAVAETLVRAGCELVVQTSSLVELRRVVADTWPSIIVLDLALAGMSGLEVVRELHASCDTCAIVVLTPFTVLREPAIAAGARGLIDANDLRDLECLLRSLTGAPRTVELEPATIRLDAQPLPAEPPGT